MNHIPTIIAKLSQLQRFGGDKPDNAVYPDGNDLFKDQRILLAAWLDPRPITTELLKEIGFEWSGGDQCWRLFVMDADNETKVIEFYRDCRVNIGYTAGRGGGFAAKATTSGSLVRLLHSIGWEK